VTQPRLLRAHVSVVDVPSSGQPTKERQKKEEK
jgi:hypothetical protein